ncbi:MAG: amino acid ABC transporter substrate-binding protein [Desulfobacterales bacterium]|nr:amino acid ABC transporter substrate-binding protein [Desulfobacterales bacterium]
MKDIYLLKILIVFFCCASQAFAQQIIKVRVTHWPPQYYQDENGNWTGTDVELGRALVEASGFKPEFHAEPWARSVESIKAGKLHLIMTFAMKPERDDFVRWLGPERQIEICLVVKKGNESLPIKNLDDMITVSKDKNMMFGQQRGAFWSENFNKKLETDSQFKDCFDIVPLSELNLKKTLYGRIIGFFEDKLAIKYQIRNDPDYKGLAIHPYVLDSRPTFFAVSRKGVDLKTFGKLLEAYEKLVKDGTMQRIRDRWTK